MPLPQQVIDRLSNDPPETPGWSFGIIMFSGGIFLLLLLIYFGLTIGYTDYLNSQLQSQATQATKLGQTITTSDQTNLINFYSETTNLNTLLANHIYTSQFLAWLEANTQANTYFSSFSLSLAPAGDRATLTVVGASEADLLQQLDIFEASSQVQSMTISGITLTGATGAWQCSVSLTMDPSVFTASTVAAGA